MSFYRSFVAAIATLGLATAVFAADETSTTTTTTTTEPAAEASAPVAQTETTTTTTVTQEKVNVNTATAKDLMKVKGLNAAKAKAIVSYRKKHGDFKSLDDLKEVKGFKKMSEEKMKSIQDQLTVG